MRSDVYGINTSDEVQSFRHARLIELVAVPVMPGGYALVSASGTIVVQPQQAFRVPKIVWTTTPSMCRRPWAERITEEEYFLNDFADESQSCICPHCGKGVNEPVEPIEPEVEAEVEVEPTPQPSKTKAKK